MLFALVIATSLSLSRQPAPIWRLLTGLTTAALAWRPIRTVIFQSDPASILRFEWAAEGTWVIEQRNGIRRQVSLHPASAVMGPWILLVWRESPALFARRWYALIDASCAGPVSHAASADRVHLRALRGRLKIQPKRVRLTRRREEPTRAERN